MGRYRRQLAAFLFLCLILGARGSFAAFPEIDDLIAAFESGGSSSLELLLSQSPRAILDLVNATPFPKKLELNAKHPEAWNYLNHRLMQIALASPTPVAPRGTVNDTWTNTLTRESLRYGSQADVRSFIEQASGPFTGNFEALQSTEADVRVGNWFADKTLPILWQPVFSRLAILRANGCLADTTSDEWLRRPECLSVLRQIYGALTEAWLVRPQPNFIPGAAIRVGGRAHADGWHVRVVPRKEQSPLLVIDRLIEIKPSVVGFHQKGMYQIHGFLRRLLDPTAKIHLYGREIPRDHIRVNARGKLRSLDELSALLDEEIMADGEISDDEWESPAVAFDGRWGPFVDLFRRNFSEDFFHAVMPSDEIADIERHLTDLPNRPVGRQIPGELSLYDNRDWAVRFLQQTLRFPNLTETNLWDALFLRESHHRSVIVRVNLGRAGARRPVTPTEVVTLDPRLAGKDYSAMIVDISRSDAGYRRLLLTEHAEKLSFLTRVFLPYSGWRGMLLAPGRHRSISISSDRLRIEGSGNMQPLTFVWGDPAEVGSQPVWKEKGNEHVLTIPHGYVWEQLPQTYLDFDRGLLGHDLKRFHDDDEIELQKKALGEWELDLKEGQAKVLRDYEADLDANPGKSTGIYVLGPMAYGKKQMMVQAIRARMRRLLADPKRNVFLVVTRYRTVMERISAGLRRYPDRVGEEINFEHLSWESDAGRRRVGSLKKLHEEAAKLAALGKSLVLTVNWDYLSKRVGDDKVTDDLAVLRNVIGGIYVDEADQIGIDDNRAALNKLVQNNEGISFWAQEDTPVRQEIIDTFCKGNVRSVYDVPIKDRKLEEVVGDHIETGIARGDLTPLETHKGSQVITHFTPEQIMKGYGAVAFDPTSIYGPLADDIRESAYAFLAKKLEPTIRRNKGIYQGVRTATQAEQLAEAFQKYFDERRVHDERFPRLVFAALHAGSENADDILRRLQSKDPSERIDWVVTPQMFNLRRFIPELTAAILSGEDKDPQSFLDFVGQLMEPALGKRRVEIVQISRVPSLKDSLLQKLGKKRVKLEVAAARGRKGPRGLRVKSTSTSGTAPNPTVNPVNSGASKKDPVPDIVGPLSAEDVAKLEANHAAHKIAFFNPTQIGAMSDETEKRQAFLGLLRRFYAETSTERLDQVDRRCSAKPTAPEQIRCYETWEALQLLVYEEIILGMEEIFHPNSMVMSLWRRLPRPGASPRAATQKTLHERIEVFKYFVSTARRFVALAVPETDSSPFKYVPHPVLPEAADVTDTDAAAFFRRRFGYVPEGFAVRFDAILESPAYQHLNLGFESAEFARELGPELAAPLDTQFELSSATDLFAAFSIGTPEYLSARSGEWPIAESEVRARVSRYEDGETPTENLKRELFDVAARLADAQATGRMLSLRDGFSESTEANLRAFNHLLAEIPALLSNFVRVFPNDPFFAGQKKAFADDLAEEGLTAARVGMRAQTLAFYYLRTYSAHAPPINRNAPDLNYLFSLSAEQREQLSNAASAALTRVDEVEAEYRKSPGAQNLTNAFSELAREFAVAVDYPNYLDARLDLAEDTAFDVIRGWLNRAMNLAYALNHGDWVTGGDVLEVINSFDGTALVKELNPISVFEFTSFSGLIDGERARAAWTFFERLYGELDPRYVKMMVDASKRRPDPSLFLDGWSKVREARIKELIRVANGLFGANHISDALETLLKDSKVVPVTVRNLTAEESWAGKLDNLHQKFFREITFRFPALAAVRINDRRPLRPLTIGSYDDGTNVMKQLLGYSPSDQVSPSMPLLEARASHQQMGVVRNVNAAGLIDELGEFGRPFDVELLFRKDFILSLSMFEKQRQKAEANSALSVGVSVAEAIWQNAYQTAIARKDLHPAMERFHVFFISLGSLPLKERYEEILIALRLDLLVLGQEWGRLSTLHKNQPLVTRDQKLWKDFVYRLDAQVRLLSALFPRDRYLSSLVAYVEAIAEIDPADQLRKLIWQSETWVDLLERYLVDTYPFLDITLAQKEPMATQLAELAQTTPNQLNRQLDVLQTKINRGDESSQTKNRLGKLFDAITQSPGAAGKIKGAINGMSRSYLASARSAVGKWKALADAYVGANELALADLYDAQNRPNVDAIIGGPGASTSANGEPLADPTANLTPTTKPAARTALSMLFAELQMSIHEEMFTQLQIFEAIVRDNASERAKLFETFREIVEARLAPLAGRFDAELGPENGISWAINAFGIEIRAASPEDLLAHGHARTAEFYGKLMARFPYLYDLVFLWGNYRDGKMTTKKGPRFDEYEPVVGEYLASDYVIQERVLDTVTSEFDEKIRGLLPGALRASRRLSGAAEVVNEILGEGDVHFHLAPRFRPNRPEFVHENYVRLLSLVRTQLNKVFRSDAMQILGGHRMVPGFSVTQMLFALMAIAPDDPYLVAVTAQLGYDEVRPREKLRDLLIGLSEHLHEHYPELGMPVFEREGTVHEFAASLSTILPSLDPDIAKIDWETRVVRSADDEDAMHQSAAGDISRLLDVSFGAEIAAAPTVFRYQTLIAKYREIGEAIASKVQVLVGPNRYSDRLREITEAIARTHFDNRSGFTSNADYIRTEVARIVPEFGGLKTQFRFVAADGATGEPGSESTTIDVPPNMRLAIGAMANNVSNLVGGPWPVSEADAEARITRALGVLELPLPRAGSPDDFVVSGIKDIGMFLAMWRLEYWYVSADPDMTRGRFEPLLNDLKRLTQACLEVYPKDRALTAMLTLMNSLKPEDIKMSSTLDVYYERLAKYLFGFRKRFPQYVFDERLADEKIETLIGEADSLVGKIRSAQQTWRKKQTGTLRAIFDEVTKGATWLPATGFIFDEAKGDENFDLVLAALDSYRDELRKFKRRKGPDFSKLVGYVPDTFVRVKFVQTPSGESCGNGVATAGETTTP